MATVAMWSVPFAILLALLYSASVHIVPGSPDGATVLLEGQTMSGGNLALKGWALSLDSFWTIDAAFYAVAVRIVGLRLDLLHFVPALLALLTIVVAVLVARDRRSGLGGIASGATVVALLALPGPDLAYYLLQGPWHIGTALYCLVAFFLLSRARLGWGWVLAVILFAAGLVSDLLVLAFGVIPCLLSGLVAMLRCRRWRAGATTVGAALASLLVAAGIQAAAHVAGTFTLVNRNLPIRLTRVWANVGHLGNRLPGLLGVGSIPVKNVANGALAFQWLHLFGLGLVALGVIVAGWHLARGVVSRRVGDREAAESWRLDDLLFTGVLTDVVFFVWGSPSGNLEYTKYLTAGVIFAIILAARMVGRFVEHLSSRRARISVIAGGVACIALFAGEFLAGIAQPAPLQPNQALDQFLVAHHLRNGIGDYWSSSLVTVGTGGHVAVRPVATDGNDHLERFTRQSSVDWYRGQQFTFLVYDSARPWHGVNATSAISTYGNPAHRYDVGTYRVLVWSHPFPVSLSAPNYGSPLQIFWSLRSGDKEPARRPPT